MSVSTLAAEPLALTQVVEAACRSRSYGRSINDLADEAGKIAAELAKFDVVASSDQPFIPGYFGPIWKPEELFSFLDKSTALDPESKANLVTRAMKNIEARVQSLVSFVFTTDALSHLKTFTTKKFNSDKGGGELELADGIRLAKYPAGALYNQVGTSPRSLMLLPGYASYDSRTIKADDMRQSYSPQQGRSFRNIGGWLLGSLVQVFESESQAPKGNGPVLKCERGLRQDEDGATRLHGKLLAYQHSDEDACHKLGLPAAYGQGFNERKPVVEASIVINNDESNEVELTKFIPALAA